MAKYEKIPQIIDAVEYDGDVDNAVAACSPIGSCDSFVFKEHDKSLTVTDGAGNSTVAMPGDYLKADTTGTGGWIAEGKTSFEGEFQLAPVVAASTEETPAPAATPTEEPPAEGTDSTVHS